MFTTLHLQNFRAWREEQSVALAPVTILLGANSSGKSSLLQCLLLLRQTAEAADRHAGLCLAGDKAHGGVDLGRFEDVLSQGAPSGELGLGFSFQLPHGAAGTVDAGEFRARYGVSARQIVVQELTLAGADRRFCLRRQDGGAYSLFDGVSAEPRGTSPAFAPERSVDLPTDAVALLGSDGPLVQDISMAIRRALEGIIYLGPQHYQVERDYAWDPDQEVKAGSDGAGAVRMLLANPGLRLIVSAWLARFGLADSLELRPSARPSRYEVTILRDGVTTNLVDAGAGMAQVLPLIVAACAAIPGATILMEGPEAHLHPLAQAVLAEMLVDISRAHQVQFIVETHSEHLFRRLQTMVASGKSEHGQCRIHFVELREGRAVIRDLELDHFGRVRHWPEHFFGDALGETRRQAEWMIRRLKRGRAGSGSLSD